MIEKPQEIRPGINIISNQSSRMALRCNSYVISEKKEAILIYSGSLFEIDKFIDYLKQIIQNRKITYIILQELSPSVSSSLAYLLDIFDAILVVHKRADMWLKEFGFIQPKYFIDENNFKLRLNNGRELNFIETPYLPSYNSFITFDVSSKTIFSSYLFSARTLKWKLYADRVFYKESMKSFHELHIPGNRFLGPVMEMIAKIKEKYNLKAIASAHGSVINESFNVYIDILKDLDCGIAFNPIINDITRKEGYILMCNQILEKYLTHFSKEEILEIFEDSSIDIDLITLKIKDYKGTGEELWEKLFARIYTKKGSRWLSVVHEQVSNYIKEYHIARPTVFNEKEKEIIKIDQENIRLKEEISNLETNLEKTTENITRDKVTKLYNEFFLRDFLKNIIFNDEENLCDFVLLILEIDEVWKIKRKYGKQGDEKIIKIIQILADILKIEASEKNYQLFKMTSEGAFLFYIQNENIENAIYFSEKVRNDVAGSLRFQENITVSCGLVASDEFENQIVNENLLLLIAFTRLGKAKSQGLNQICFSSEIQKIVRKTILIVESDILYEQLLVSELEQLNYHILSCSDGFSAIKMIEKYKPDLIISELMIPKDNGLSVRERMLQVSTNQNIPYILISHLKNEETVKRALNLRVNYYLRKPFMMCELIGLTKNLLEK